MESKKARNYIYISLLCVFLFLCIVVSASVGSSSINPVESLKLVLNKIPLINRVIDTTDIKEIYEVIIWKVRLPRILQASLVGGGLAVVGCTFQAVFRNSLADPHILGISSGASLGATIAILSGLTLNFLGIGIISIFAFIGAIATVMLVYKVGGLGGKIITTNLLLTGTAIGTMLSSVISLLMIYNRDNLEKVYLWTLGSFSSANWSKVLFMFIVSLISVVILFVFSRDLNVILTGDEVAASLGIDTVKLKNLLIIFCAILVAASVSVSGTIGFVDLIAPHVVRKIFGSKHSYVVPMSAVFGGCMMILTDLVARTIVAPSELPVGAITALIGAPFFAYIYFKKSK